LNNSKADHTHLPDLVLKESKSFFMAGLTKEYTATYTAINTRFFMQLPPFSSKLMILTTNIKVKAILCPQ
jgi:hypothetical protein